MMPAFSSPPATEAFAGRPDEQDRPTDAGHETMGAFTALLADSPDVSPPDVSPEDSPEDSGVAGFAAAASAAPGEAAAPAEPESLAFDAALLQPVEDAPAAATDQTLVSVLAGDPPFEDALPDEAADSLADPAGAGHGGTRIQTVSTGPAAALAFFMDSNTEEALCEGLFGYEGFSADCGEPQVRQGDIRAAIAALAAGNSSQLIFVDIDGCPYPAGAIHELAAVCEVGTVVVAIGSDASAGPGRELLLAGVRDYLAKPLTADAVRAVAGYAAIPEEDIRPGGCAVSFVGTGGSGTTTLTAAVALQAAARGCYVSVLDLNRSVAATALSLGVEPSAGLDQLLETAERTAPEPEMLDAVCARRSDRIAVYAHRWSSTQPEVPAAEAVDWVISALKRRSKLVLVEGIDALEMRFAPMAEVDTRVLVAEPTAGRAAEAARMMELLGANDPLLFVQNHTRAFRKGTGERAFLNAGIETAPDVVIPFDPSVPDIADRGWPRSRLPRSLREPVTALTERLLSLLAGGARGSFLPQQGH